MGISILRAQRTLRLGDLFKLTQNFLKSFDHVTHFFPQSTYYYFIKLKGGVGCVCGVGEIWGELERAMSQEQEYLSLIPGSTIY